MTPKEQRHLKLVSQAAKRMATTTRPKQTAKTFFRHLNDYLEEPYDKNVSVKVDMTTCGHATVERDGVKLTIPTEDIPSVISGLTILHNALSNQ